MASVAQANHLSADCDVSSPSDTLEEFARKCDDAIGDTVPDFDCDSGSCVDEGNVSAGSYGNQTCDRPNVLEGVCDPGSRYQNLPSSNPNVLMVAHCRKQGNDPGFYGDIAVIQYNKSNGATCFYQALGTLSGVVTAPSKGNGGGMFPWLNPATTAGINCVKCHDNGPFVRSPYIAHLADDPVAVAEGNVLPGSHDSSWNKTLPYKFVGSDFQTWKAYSITVPSAQSACASCHRMGLSSVGDTFQEVLGLR